MKVTLSSYSCRNSEFYAINGFRHKILTPKAIKLRASFELNRITSRCALSRCHLLVVVIVGKPFDVKNVLFTEMSEIHNIYS